MISGDVMSRKFQKKSRGKSRNVMTNKEKDAVVLPLSMDMEKITTMASVYSFIAKNRIPYLFMNRVMKSLRGLTGKESERVSALIAIHSDSGVVESGILTAYGDGVNYDVYLRLEAEDGTVIYGADKDFRDEYVLIESLKERWEIHFEDGHGLHLLAFESLPEMDKALGITTTVEVQKELIREISIFDDLMTEAKPELVDAIEYRTTSQIAREIGCAIIKLKKSNRVFESRDVMTA